MSTPTPTHIGDLGAAPGVPATAKVAAPPARHWNGLRDVVEVPTPTFKLAQAQLERVVGIGGIAAVSGRPGCGKTFSVDYFLHHSPTMTGRPHVWLDSPRKPTTKALTIRLATALGLKVNPRDSEYLLVEELMPHLQTSNAVVVIDESQHLPVDGLQQLRYFHDRCFPTRPGDPSGWALVLVGSTVDRQLSGAAELASRVSAWVRFEPLSDTDLLLALRAWHPLLAEMEPALLLQLDQTQCRGNWRNWAQFLSAYLFVHDRKPATSHADRVRLTQAAIAAVNRRPS